jgi:hypothetical protein
VFGGLMLAALAAGGCSAAEARREPVRFTTQDWKFGGVTGSELTTDHYVIRTTCRAKLFVDALPAFQEACWESYAALLPADRALPHKAETYLFQSRWEWERFTEQFTGARAATYKKIRSGGYSERGVTVSHYGSRRSTLSILAHEGLHQYLELTHGTDIPPWVNEGLACYFEAFDLDDAGRPVFRPESNTLRSPALRESLTRSTLIPLREILGTHAGLEVHKPTRQVSGYYAQEWSLVLFLMRPAKENPWHDGFRRLLTELGSETMQRRARAFMAADTEGTLSIGEAIFRAYVTDDIELFEASYIEYLHALTGLAS